MYAHKLYDKMNNAIKSGRNFEKANRGIVHRGNIIKVFYYDTLIAKIDTQKSTIVLNNSGWNTLTTKETLNNILSLYGLGHIFQRNYVWYYKPLNGNAVKFKNRMVLDYE